MELVAILLKDTETARAARAECVKMASNQLITLEDAVVVYKEDGKIKLDQSVNLTKAGALGGAWWGTLIGAMLGVFTGGFGIILAGMAGGAAGGALGGWMSDIGVSDEMMKKTGEAIKNNQAILFIAGRTSAPDKALERLEQFGGTVVRSSLSKDVDKKIDEALATAATAKVVPAKADTKTITAKKAAT